MDVLKRVDPLWKSQYQNGIRRLNARGGVLGAQNLVICLWSTHRGTVEFTLRTGDFGAVEMTKRKGGSVERHCVPACVSRPRFCEPRADPPHLIPFSRSFTRIRPSSFLTARVRDLDPPSNDMTTTSYSPRFRWSCIFAAPIHPKYRATANLVSPTTPFIHARSLKFDFLAH